MPSQTNRRLEEHASPVQDKSVAAFSYAKRPLIIQRPDLQSGVQLWGSRVTTVAFWGLWLYLFMPLLSVLAWAAGLMLIYELLVQNLPLSELWELLRVYGIGIGVLLVLYLGYAFAGFLRFRRTERRKHTAVVSPEQLAQSHNLDMETFQTLHTGHSVTVSADVLERMFAKRL